MPPKPPGTLEEWRELSRRLRAEADEIDQAIAVLARKSGAPVAEEPIEAPSEVTVPPELISPLPSGSHSGITYSMTSTQIDSVAKKRRTGPPLKSKGPVAKVARILGVSVAEVARLAKQNVYSMRTWNERDQVPPEVKAILADLVATHEKAAEKAAKRSR